MPKIKEKWYHDVHTGTSDLVLKDPRGRPKLKYPPKKVEEILQLLKQGLSFADIAREYNCTRQYIHQLKNRWKHLL